jgi:hypothetical protein
MAVLSKISHKRISTIVRRTSEDAGNSTELVSTIDVAFSDNSAAIKQRLVHVSQSNRSNGGNDAADKHARRSPSDVNNDMWNAISTGRKHDSRCCGYKQDARHAEQAERCTAQNVASAAGKCARRLDHYKEIALQRGRRDGQVVCGGKDER